MEPLKPLACSTYLGNVVPLIDIVFVGRMEKYLEKNISGVTTHHQKVSTSIGNNWVLAHCLPHEGIHIWAMTTIAYPQSMEAAVARPRCRSRPVPWVVHREADKYNKHYLRLSNSEAKSVRDPNKRKVKRNAISTIARGCWSLASRDILG